MNNNSSHRLYRKGLKPLKNFDSVLKDQSGFSADSKLWWVGSKQGKHPGSR